MLKLFAALISTFALFWLGIAGTEWYEHRPVGQPTWAHVNFLWFHLGLPDSLSAKLSSDEGKLKIADDNVARLEHSLTVQNAAIRAASQAGVTAQAGSEKAVAAWRLGSAATGRKIALLADALPAATSNTTECQKSEAVDQAFLSTLRQQ